MLPSLSGIKWSHDCPQSPDPSLQLKLSAKQDLIIGFRSDADWLEMFLLRVLCWQWTAPLLISIDWTSREDILCLTSAAKGHFLSVVWNHKRTAIPDPLSICPGRGRESKGWNERNAFWSSVDDCHLTKDRPWIDFTECRLVMKVSSLKCFWILKKILLSQINFICNSF